MKYLRGVVAFVKTASAGSFSAAVVGRGEAA